MIAVQESQCAHPQRFRAMPSDGLRCCAAIPERMARFTTP